MSIRPGSTHFPPASITLPSNFPGEPAPGRISMIFPSAMTILPVSSLPVSGSITRPPAMSSIVSSREKIEERHADGDTGLYLVEYDRWRAVGRFLGPFPL